MGGEVRRRRRRQDEIPVFQQRVYTTRNVTANTRNNTRLITVVATGPANIRYSVDNPRLFRIDDDGNVYTNTNGRQLMQGGLLNFTVLAVNPEHSHRAASATVLVSANQPPKFSDPAYAANVYENANGGSLVRAVAAQDRDTDVISYFIRPEPGAPDVEEFEMFTINRQTGVIRLVTRPFQFTEEDYSFLVIARDTHNQNDTAAVHVHIIDVNNNRPMFPDCENYRPEVEENKPSGTPVLTVEAIDADKGENAEVEYSLVTSPSSPESFFDIDRTTGQLTTLKVFNRDEPDHEKELRVIVKANDRGSPSLEGTCAFVVNVRDVNDNHPMFDKSSYQESIPRDTELNSAVLRISATDADSDENGTVEYDLTSLRDADAGYFSVDPRTGVITLVRRLEGISIDYDFRLTATARDRGADPLSAEVSVIITVKDSNTRPPTFILRPNQTYHLPENFRDTEAPIARVKAVSNSPDSPAIYYDIVAGSQEQTNRDRTFVVEEDGDGGAIVKYGGSRQLDYEKLESYNITVRATTDQQTGAEVTFRIDLEDSNDEVPIFYNTDPVTVPENSEPGTYVTKTSAIDKDGTAPNNQVTYRFEPNSEEEKLFSIDPNTGEIKTRERFDREDLSRPSPFYTVTVVAEDGAPSGIRNTSRPNTVKQRIKVEIGDVNDNPPVFDPNRRYKATISEQANKGANVMEVLASDQDSDSKIQYQITDGNYGGVFDIDSDTGIVRVKNALDFERVNTYKITVTASDGKYEATHAVDINVTNINDVPPVFDKPSYQLKMSEGPRDSSEPIVKVTATDPDPVSGVSSIVYKLSGPGVFPEHPEDDVFSINENGEVLVQKILDRDEGTGGREVWELSVQAWDEGGIGQGNSVPFTLTLTDINDNAPYLVQSEDTRQVIMENKSPEGVVIPVEADDFDDHQWNGPPYTFALDPDAPAELHDMFSVTTVEQDNRAEIRPLVSFDREMQKEYNIPVVVSDRDTASPTSLTGTSLFTIIIGDENDNDMKDGVSAISVFNFEGKMPDTVVGRVYVDDPDDWDLPDKTFSWLEGEEYRHFELDRDTGNITMKYGTPNGSYPLKFQVFDKKFQSTVSALVTVEVRLLPREAVTQSGSLRIKDVSAAEFVSRPDKDTPSMHERLITELARLFSTAPENVDLFGVVDNDDGGVDVRYAAHGSPYYEAEKMDGIVAQNRDMLETMFGIKIEQVGINDCIYEHTCEGSCHAELKIFDNEVYRVQTNTSSIIGVKTELQYKCNECEAKMAPEICLHDGRWSEDQKKCECEAGFPGPNCQGDTIHFEGTGYAWFPQLTACNASHLSFDLTTVSEEALVMYNGPISEPSHLVQDFFAVDVMEGRLRVFMNYGTGTAVASPALKISDNHKHHIDITWDPETMVVLIDSCVGSSECQASAAAPAGPDGQKNSFLNVDTPLQLGGSAVPLDQVAAVMTSWDRVPGWGGFTGCVQNMTFLDRVFDLAQPADGVGYSSHCSELAKATPVIETSSSFLAVLLACLAILLILVIVVIMYRRRHVRTLYKEPVDEMRDTIINYDDEGGGEKDQTGYDLSVLQVQANGVAPKDAMRPVGLSPSGQPPSVRSFIDDNKNQVDRDEQAWPSDDCRNYAYEGGGSSAGSLSSLNSGTDDNDLNFDILNEFGPRFRKLADMYGGGDDDDDEPPPPPVGGRPSSMAGESWC
ncbi:DE-cadherin-like isoform X2 [Amphibalanus amphitrite]|uniref:DE-cadherin-like isoform X2 n=1 Tax=Amphibalanus amphitrite TaxID=1232801 RepID=UPI001C901D5C|nr:DE-cadherin-like isoform X2 [Amphibalanus amphitrite]